MEKILTVAIPTYNRAKYLDLLLSGLLSQVEDLRGWVDIVISDNCSTDGTREVVRRSALPAQPAEYGGDLEYYKMF